MLKRVAAIALSSTLLICLVYNTAFAEFSDVTPTSKNYTAIQYLKINNIISGFTDGTFRPAQAVTRAELLKIMIGSLKIPLTQGTPSGFTDVDETAWYGPYVDTARENGWISGYGDGSFKPAQSVTKAEAIKIIAMAEKWTLPGTGYKQPYLDTPLTEWFTPFIYEAKLHNFLEETSRFYAPSAQITRGQVSEVLFRINITKSNKADTYSTTFLKNLNLNETSPGIPTQLKEYTSQEILNLGYKSYPANFYEGMTLNSSFPNIFYQNEIYYFEGTLSSTGKQVFLFLAPDKAVSPDNYINYVGDITGNKFTIAVTFNTAGKFKMGIIPGESGESKIVDINVIPGIPKAAQTINASFPSAPQINYSNQQTSVSWLNNGNDFNKITFTQGSTSNYFICRQNKGNITIDYSKFQSFKPGSVDLKVEGAKTNPQKPYELSTGWNVSPITKFIAAKHVTSNMDPAVISAANFPYTKSTVDKITFSGNTKANINVEAAIIKPDGMVEITELSTSATLLKINHSEAIPAGSSYSFSFTPSTEGTYSIEINNMDGQAVLNMPVYIKNGIPLIPDYFDLHQNDPPVANYDLESYRSQLLKLINEERASVGIDPVIIDVPLNNLSQAYTNDMAKRAFFGHYNPEGLGPDERRIAAGIASQVGENLANAPDIFFTHYGLVQSAIHLKNILDPKWTKVGIGMTKNTDGYFLTAEEFSSNPLTESDLSGIEQDIINKLNQKRSSNSLNTLTEDSALNNIAVQWSNTMISQDFFSFTSPNGQTLSDLISKSGLNRTIQAIILESNNTDTLINEVLTNAESQKNTWREIGISIKTDNIGTLKATLLFSN